MGLSIAGLNIVAFAGGSERVLAQSTVEATETAVLEEITITAQRREESLQKSSLAIEVLDDKTLREAGIRQITDIGAAAPGVQIGTGGAAAQVYIRGVGDYGANASTNPAIAFNLDGVYTARTQAIAGTFFDLARLEVLKGPQGTLYGRNASGGAINLVPNQPVLSEFGGYAEVSAQNYGGVAAEAAINLPLGNTVAARVSGQVAHRDGYLSDGTNDDVHQSARVQLLWKPSGRFDVRLWGAYSHVGGKGNGFALYDPASVFAPVTSNLDPWTSIASSYGNAIYAGANAALSQPPPVGRGPSPTGSWLDPIDSTKLFQDMDFTSTHAEINWHMDWATLTAIPAYQSAAMAYRAFPALSYSTTDDLGESEASYASSLEIRLSNNTDDLKWVLGGYYYDENQQVHSLIDNGFIQRLSVVGQSSTQSYAGFGQATKSIARALRVIAGLRYTHESKDSDLARYNFAPSTGCYFGGAPNTPTKCLFDTPTGQVTDSAVNYRGGFELDLADDNMLFVTVATGFKAGGISQANVQPYRPEELTAYTLGSRNRFLGQSLQVNAEVFYYDYKDHQEFIVAVDDVGKVGAFVVNAGNAKSYGASLDATWVPTKADKLRGALEYVHAKYDSFVYHQPTATIPPGSVGCASAIDPSKGFVTLAPGVVSPYTRIDCSGNQMIRTPEWSGMASYTRVFDLGNGGSIDAGADVTYASERWLATYAIANLLAPSYVVWNASVGYRTPSGKIQIAAFARNIGNEAVYTGGNESTFVGGLVGANIAAPRTYGLRVRAEF
jgi:iron complex outermembrane receptor protein